MGVQIYMILYLHLAPDYLILFNSHASFQFNNVK